MESKSRKLVSYAAIAAVLGLGYGLGEVQALSPHVAHASLVAESPPAPPNVPTPVAFDGAASMQNLFVNIADRTMPSVVNIFTTKNVRLRRHMGMNGPGDLYDFWGRFFDDQWGDPGPFGGSAMAQRGQSEVTSRPMALGTGFVIEARHDGTGMILTNNHVIAGADGVKVKFTESDQEREVPAEIVGTDPDLDIALLRVKTNRKLQAVALGDSDRLKVGEWIAALGNPFGHGHSLSHGIVSAKERALPGGFGNYLQVDAPINPGNSGGPLVDMAGEVVGINNAIDARGPGIGFAIPINAVKAELSELEAHGRVERGYVGIGLQAREDDGAPLVARVMPGGPAARAGLREGDVLLKVDGHEVRDANQVVSAITAIPVGRTVSTDVERDGRALSFNVRIAKRPDMRQALNE